MKPHIKSTLDELNSDIATLTATRDNLEALYGGSNDTERAPAATSKRRRKPSAPDTTAERNGEGATQPTEPGPIHVGSVQEKVLIAARKLPEPFTAEALAVATGLDKKAAGNCLFLLGQKGLVQAVGNEGLAKTYRVA